MLRMVRREFATWELLGSRDLAVAVLHEYLAWLGSMVSSITKKPEKS